MESRGNLGPTPDLMLDSAGSDFDVVFAHAGKQTIESFARHTISLILTAMEMPTKDGYAATREIIKSKRSNMDDIRS